MKFLHVAWCAALAVSPLSFLSPASAQDSDFLVQNTRADGTLWFHTLPPKRSAGSAQLGSLDLGPPSPPNVVSGIQSVWLEWNQTHVYAGLLGGGLASVEIPVDPPADPTPIASCLGAATLNGGWILTTDLGSGALTDVRACVGSFVWTPTHLYLVAIGGGIDVDEVLYLGVPVVDVQGVAVIESGIFDLDLDPDVVAGHIIASALVYTPSSVYHVDVDLSAGVSYAITEVLTPALAPIAKARGVTVAASGFDFSVSPPVPHGEAFVWNDGHVYLVSKTAALATSEIFDAGGGAIAASWGVMSTHYGAAPGPRFAALVWQQAKAWAVVADPALTVLEATLPPGGPLDPSLVSNVAMPTGPTALLVERQAGHLYEVLANFVTSSGNKVRGLVIGHNQRSP